MKAAPQTVSDDSAISKSRWARATSDASDDAREALSELAASYDYCVYAWWRRAGREAEAAMAASSLLSIGGSARRRRGASTRAASGCALGSRSGSSSLLRKNWRRLSRRRSLLILHGPNCVTRMSRPASPTRSSSGAGR